MQLSLTADETIVLQAVVERYLDEVRTDSGRDEVIRPKLKLEQDMLIAIEARLHALAEAPRADPPAV